MNERAVRCEREGRDAWAACTGLLAMCAQHAVSLACLLCGPWPIWGGLALCMLWRAASYMELRRCVERANKATAMSMVRYRS